MGTTLPSKGSLTPNLLHAEVTLETGTGLAAGKVGLKLPAWGNAEATTKNVMLFDKTQ